ncbi:MAG: exosortase/archaeosortase family protein [Candidatus Rokubacteria bacterium]|nr:exosortase/archaeosortase family protein [Candidatus Rokubacteria bacterium]
MTALARVSSQSIGGTAVLVLGGLLAVAYVPVLIDVTVVAWSVSYYSHALLVPLFSAWLLWQDRRSRNGGPPAILPGVLLLGIAAAVLVTGTVAASLTLRALSIVPGAFGIALLTAGRAGTRASAFPIGFLVLMVPLPSGAIPQLSLPLQQLAANVAAFALNTSGIPSIQQGLLVHMPNGISLHVTEACNGLRFLFAMLVVGVAFAGLAVRGTIRRGLTVLLALAIAIAANLVRVSGTGVIAYAWGPEAASGFMHVAYGKIVYAVMLVPFAAVVLLLRRSSVSVTSR